MGNYYMLLRITQNNQNNQTLVIYRSFQPHEFELWFKLLWYIFHTVRRFVKLKNLCEPDVTTLGLDIQILPKDDLWLQIYSAKLSFW